MKFEAIQRETVILDPNNNMERKTIPSEIRKDPLTGRTSRRHSGTLPVLPR
jgi:hypothetical protein